MGVDEVAVVRQVADVQVVSRNGCCLVRVRVLEDDVVARLLAREVLAGQFMGASLKGNSITVFSRGVLVLAGFEDSNDSIVVVVVVVVVVQLAHHDTYVFIFLAEGVQDALISVDGVFREVRLAVRVAD